jgi:hypothetical protein
MFTYHAIGNIIIDDLIYKKYNFNSGETFIYGQNYLSIITIKNSYFKSIFILFSMVSEAFKTINKSHFCNVSKVGNLAK